MSDKQTADKQTADKQTLDKQALDRQAWDKQAFGSPDSKGGKKKFSSWLHSSAPLCALIVLIAGLVAFGLYCAICSPRQYDLSVGSISHETINATKDVVDEVTTEDRRQAAANAVEPTYRFEDGVKEEVLSSLSSLFGELGTVQQYAETLQKEDAGSVISFTDEEIAYAQGLVTGISLSRYQVSTLLRTPKDQFDKMVSLVTTAVSNSLNTTIREGQVAQSIQTIIQIVGYQLDVSLTQNIVPTVLRACVKPNMTIEQEATEQARQAARDAIEPVVYLQGQNIVREGDRITRSQLEMLRSLGLLKNDSYDLSSYIGALLIVLLSFCSMLLGLRLLNPEILRDPRKLSVTLSVLDLGLVLSIITYRFVNPYFIPTAFVPLLLTALLNPNVGMAGIASSAILISGLAAVGSGTFIYETILLMLTCLSGGMVAVWFLKGNPQRVQVVLSGILLAVINSMCIYAVALLTSSDSFNPMSTVLWGMGAGILSGALAVGFQIVYEAVFHLATSSKLLELCNPDQPLLRRLQLEAPGTYHHSLIVANLAEAAAEKVGANPYLARAAGYYHDIGKLMRPTYFKENQGAENPHDNLDPYVSAAILTSHTRDGFQLGQKNGLPREMTDIILQHHGDTPVMYFYHKALQMSDGSPVDISEFRYQGPRPNTRESAIVMLADTIEAAVRSMKGPTPKAINQFIERLVRGKLEDGQLSGSPITLRDIDDICTAFSNVLMGVFHERIEYPEVKHRIIAQGNPGAQGAQEAQAAQAAQGNSSGQGSGASAGNGAGTAGGASAGNGAGTAGGASAGNGAGTAGGAETGSNNAGNNNTPASGDENKASGSET